MKRKIEKQRLHIAELEESAAGVAISFDGLPKSSRKMSTVEKYAENMEVEKIKLERLEIALRNAISKIPDEYIKEIVHLRIEKNRSWQWIALKQGGNNTDDCIKKMCYRYFWKC